MASRVGKYLLLETLGTGSFGKVKLGVHEESGDRVAVKIMDKSEIKAHEMATNVRREIAIMKALEHRNIVNLRQVLTSANKLYIVMDLVTGGELFTKIYKHGALPEPLSRKYFQELIDGVSYCHSKGVYHRDLKPENLLIDEATGSLKITDFGLSTMVGVNTVDEMLHTMCGSPNYCAPEIIMRSKTGYSGAKVDAWACGIVLFALLTGYLPFYDDNQKNLYRMIATQPARFPPKFPDDAKDLINKLLEKDPNQRITVEGVKSHPWFKRGYVDVKSASRQILNDQPRTYHFKAPAGRSSKVLVLRNLPQNAQTRDVIVKYDRTPVGEKMQRIDDAIQRYRIVFAVRSESLQLRPELRRRDGSISDTAMRALSVTEAVALSFMEQLVGVVTVDRNQLKATDKEIAAFEEIIGMFGAHATSGAQQWWLRVGDSTEERRRVSTLISALEPPPQRNMVPVLSPPVGVQNGSSVAEETARLLAASARVSDRQQPSAERVPSGSDARASPMVAPERVHAAPGGRAPAPPVANSRAPAPVQSVANSMSSAPAQPATNARKAAPVQQVADQRTAVPPQKITASSSFKTGVPAVRCMSIIGRVLAAMQFRVMMKKSENKLKFDFKAKNGDIVQVSVTAREIDGTTAISMKKIKVIGSNTNWDLSPLLRQVQEQFEREVQRIRASSS